MQNQNLTSISHKTIKRYANRKLYDTQTSKYVTLRDILGFVDQGIDLVVIDNVSKLQITTKTLSAALFELENSSEQEQTVDEVLARIKTRKILK